MKKTVFIFLIFFSVTGLTAQNKSVSKKNNKQRSGYYCLVVKGEEQVLTKDGKEITDEDIKLKSGDRLSIEGRIRKVDGTEIKLKEGECVNENGEVLKAK